jgi:hypothetical protein
MADNNDVIHIDDEFVRGAVTNTGLRYDCSSALPLP